MAFYSLKIQFKQLSSRLPFHLNFTHLTVKDTPSPSIGPKINLGLNDHIWKKIISNSNCFSQVSYFTQLIDAGIYEPQGIEVPEPMDELQYATFGSV